MLLRPKHHNLGKETGNGRSMLLIPWRKAIVAQAEDIGKLKEQDTLQVLDPPPSPRGDGICKACRVPGETTFRICVHAQAEVVVSLEEQASIERGFTALVWQKLEEQNEDFFRAYYTRLKLKDQIVLFNHLLEQQVQMVHRIRASAAWMAPNGESPLRMFITIHRESMELALSRPFIGVYNKYASPRSQEGGGGGGGGWHILALELLRSSVW